MSIAFGWITCNGELLAISDKRASVGNVPLSDDYDKTFSLYDNQIIGAHTGLLNFNEREFKSHLDEYISKLENVELTCNLINDLVEYLKNQLMLDNKVGFENKKVSIIFLLKINQNPTMLYYEILPNSNLNKLVISLTEKVNTFCRYKPFGNLNAFKVIDEMIKKGTSLSAVEWAKEIMINAIQEVQNIDGQYSDCGGSPSIQFIN